MNHLAIAYVRISRLLQNQEQHNLNSDDVLALENAQKAILTIEMLGLELENNEINII